MKNIQVTIEYDGTGYCGWQIQPNGLSIQQVVAEAWSAASGETIKLVGSGRTDAGVHAYGQTANFQTTATIPVDRIPYALNARLPGSIRILDAKERSMDFHSRFSAKGKVYEYRILNNTFGSSLRRNRVWHVRSSLNANRMAAAAQHFVGTHDFTSFSSIKSQSKDKVRTIYGINLNQEADEYIFTIEGNGFLYNMVRIMIGTLVDVGMGKREPDEISRLLQSKDRDEAGKTAPPQGLYLKKVIY